MSLANMSLVEELKSYYAKLKPHAHRILIGGGALSVIVSLVQGATVQQWTVWLILTYLIGLPLSYLKK